ncbi:MAG: ATP-binding protein [Hyphomonadaceae bacterium]
MTYSDKSLRARWHQETELIISSCALVFSLALLVLYSVGVKNSVVVLSATYTDIATYLFPVLCGLRLAYVRMGNPGRWFSWASMLADITILTSIIYFFSVQYGSAAASLKAPTFTFYFFVIVMHGIRFDLRIVFVSGFISAAAWLIMLGVLMMDDTAVTHSYVDYFSSASILVGAEIEKIFGLLAFTALLGFGAYRAQVLLGQAADMKLAQVALAEAEKTALMKSQFLANMSHEIRTPMNGVLGMAQLLGATELRDDQVEYVDTIEQSGKALLVILNDVLDFSKIESGKLSLVPAEFDLRGACRDVITLLGVSAEKKSISLRLEMGEDVPKYMIGDAGRLRQILTNLIGNAIKFTDKGHVILRVEGLGLGETASLTFSVKDTGIGIAKEAHGVIFGDFAQIDASSTRTAGGTGLGLSITRGLVKAMDGTINVESELGKGAVFTVELELPLGRYETRILAQAEQPKTGLPQTPVLLLGTQADVHEEQRKMLSEAGCALTYIADARAGVQALIEGQRTGTPFALVVIPEAVGEIAASHIVRTIRKRIAFDATAFVVLTASGSGQAARAKFGDMSSCVVLEASDTSSSFDMAILSALAGFQAKRLSERVLNQIDPDLLHLNSDAA